MATVVPNPPRVVWESEVKETGGRVRVVETERFSTSSASVVQRTYSVEVTCERDAMGQWRWFDVMPCGRRYHDAAIAVVVAALGSRCGRDGEKVEVDE